MDARDERDFHDFVVGQWNALLRTAYMLTGDLGDAEDLVQATLVRVHRAWPRIERRDEPVVFARKVLVNRAASSWPRRRLRLREHPTEQVPEQLGADESAAYDLRDFLVRACLRLPPRQRAVLVLRYFEDMSEADTAAALGISIGAVKSMTSRALDRLRALLAPDLAQDAGSPAGSTQPTPTSDGSPA